MAKKKKKKNKPVKSPKKQYLERKLECFKRMFEIAKACGAEEYFNRIRRELLLMIDFCTLRPFDIVPVGDLKLSSREYQILKKITHTLLKNEKFRLIEGGAEVNFYDYFYVGECLCSMIKIMNEEDRKDVAEIQAAFKPLIDFRGNTDNRVDVIENVSNLISLLFSRVEKGYWLFNYTNIDKPMPNPEFGSVFEVEFVPREIVYVVDKGIKRPAFRVGRVSYGRKRKWVQVTGEQLNLSGSFANLKVDVYIQNHALIRLYERLDCVSKPLLFCFLTYGIYEWETETNSKGQQLIVFKFNQLKLGYFVYEYIEGIVLIKTFLLLSNNLTPEGEKLYGLLGLEKEDKRYLDLDKQSHFIYSDIPKNQELYGKFKEAGCENLFNKKLADEEKEYGENIHADLIEEYLSDSEYSPEVTEMLPDQSAS